MNDDHPSGAREADRLIYAGLLGLAAASVIQLLEVASLDLSLSISMYLFAFAIPLLVVGLITDYARRSGTRIPRSYIGIGVTGVLGGVAGFAALFFHFSIPMGLTFVATSLISVWFIRRL